MDVKEIIKWLLNAVHPRTMLVLLVLMVISASAQVNDTRPEVRSIGWLSSSTAAELGRTFGKPIRKLQAAMLPIMFKLGVISTLIFLTFLLALKGVKIGMLLLIFKIFGILLKLKSELTGGHQGGFHGGYQGGWSPHKEVHLHVVPHNAHLHGADSYGPYGFPSSGGDAWSRYDPLIQAAKKVTTYTHQINHPSYQGQQQAHAVGPSSINTPYGHYVRTGDPTAPSAR